LETFEKKSLHNDIVGEMKSHLLSATDSATDCTDADHEDSESTKA